MYQTSTTKKPIHTQVFNFVKLCDLLTIGISKFVTRYFVNNAVIRMANLDIVYVHKWER